MGREDQEGPPGEESHEEEGAGGPGAAHGAPNPAVVPPIPNGGHVRRVVMRDAAQRNVDFV